MADKAGLSWSMGGTVPAPAITTAELGSLLAEARKHAQLRDGSRALAAARKAVERFPHNAEAHLVLARILEGGGRIADAERHYQEALERWSTNLTALTALGRIKLNAGDWKAAISLLERAARVDPGSIDARHFLARAYGLGMRYRHALDLFRTLVHEAPQNSEIRAGFARTLALNGKTERALEEYEKAARINPGDYKIQQGLSHAYLSVGRKKEAEECQRHVLRLHPGRGSAYFQLARMNALKPSDIQEMEGKLAAKTLDDNSRSRLLLALAHHRDRIGETAAAFDALTAANAILDRKQSYDSAAVDRHAEKVLAAMTQLTPAPKTPPGLRPIFIVGMPRSGTTLLEQMLARHPAVFAGGERTAIYEMQVQMGSMAKPYPEGLARLTAEERRKLKRAYFAHLPDRPDGVTRLTDKLPENAANLLMIEQLLPASMILICRRHPLDICYSCFSLGFGHQLPWATNLGNIAHKMLSTDRLLRAWIERRSLPTLEVFYEELVDRFETVARRVVEFIGLPWDERCLNPEEDARPVLTASAGQVHNAVYRSSAGRWQRYAPYLEETRAKLAPLIDRHERQLRERGVMAQGEL
jgi:tetratricopeptide (TPR) repeat protein